LHPKLINVLTKPMTQRPKSVFFGVYILLFCQTKTNKTLWRIPTHSGGFWMIPTDSPLQASLTCLPIVTLRHPTYSCMLLSAKEMNHGRSSLQKPFNANANVNVNLFNPKLFLEPKAWLSSLDS